MEAMREEALQAMEIAEQKMSSLDLKGAQTFAAKARKLCPSLEGLPSLLAAIHIYVNGQRKIDNESVDSYAVLGVHPKADDAILRKIYRRLAFLLHPDKNRALYANGAFKILSEAWSYVNNSASRINYDQRWNAYYMSKYPGFPGISSAGSSSQPNTARTPMATPPPPTQAPPPPPPQAASQPTPPPPPPTTARPTMAPPPLQAKPQRTRWLTFLTSCRSCKTVFEFQVRFRNRRLRCPQCRAIFLGVELQYQPAAN